MIGVGLGLLFVAFVIGLFGLVIRANEWIDKHL